MDRLLIAGRWPVGSSIFGQPSTAGPTLLLRRSLKLLCKANPITFMSLSVGVKFVYVGNVYFMIEFKYVIPPLERSSDFGFEIQNLAHMTAIQRMLFISVTRRTS